MKGKRCLFLFLASCLSAGKISAQTQDLTVVINETVLNKMVASLGEIKGSSPYSFMFIKGTYNWNLINPQFKIHPDRLDFVTDVMVDVSGYNYRMHVSGNAEVCYEPLNNLIFIEITEATFPINMMILGSMKHLWDVDLARYFEAPFVFEGPLTIGTEFVIPMPDNSTKTLYMHPLNCGVKIDEKQILVSAEVEFINRAETIKAPLISK
jgi:hypothetical protein